MAHGHESVFLHLVYRHCSFTCPPIKLASILQTTQMQQRLQELTAHTLPSVQQELAGLRVEVNTLPELRNRLQALERRLNTSTTISPTPSGSINITSANYLVALTTLQREVCIYLVVTQVEKLCSSEDNPPSKCSEIF